MLDDVVLGEWVLGPAVYGEVGVTGGGVGAGAGVGARDMSKFTLDASFSTKLNLWSSA